jgi:thiol-disulfide isomerase/thioredoxin
MTLVSLTLRADDKQPVRTKPTQAGEELRALTKEFDMAVKRFFQERNELAAKRQMTKDENERKVIDKKLREWQDRFNVARPLTKFGPRFLEFAEKNAKDPAGVQALYMVLREEYRLNGGPKGKNSLWEKALGVLQKEYVEIPEVKRLLPLLAYSGDETSEKFVRAVLEKNPDRLTQARAAQELKNASERFATLATQLKGDKQLRKEVERKNGKESVEKAIARGEKALQDVKELAALVREKYSDIIPDLSIGKDAPEIVTQDINGKKVKLSDLKGKVVVLDIWATWCQPCRAMIPHQRELVGKLKSKPFILVSISVDHDKETLKRFLEKEPMPWTHWWNGPEGALWKTGTSRTTRRFTSSTPRASSGSRTKRASFPVQNSKKP